MLIFLIAVLVIFPFAESSKPPKQTHSFEVGNVACERVHEGIYQCKIKYDGGNHDRVN